MTRSPRCRRITRQGNDDHHSQYLDDTGRAARLDEVGASALFSGAHTAHAFTDTPVSDAQLLEIWNLAKWPPTALNLQPLRVMFVRKGASRDTLVDHLADGNKAKTAAAPAVAILAVDDAFHEHIPLVAPRRPELRDYFAADAEAGRKASDFNAALQAGYFVLATRAVGLGAGPMGGYDAAGIDRDFFADRRWRTAMVVNIGHPGENAWRDREPRLPDDTTVAWA